MAQVYRTIGEKYGVKYSEDEILMRYGQAYSQPWGKSRLRYVDDGRPFWQHIVSSSTDWTLNLSLQSSTKILPLVRQSTPILPQFIR
ncbi:hypothetical protein ZWY2020_042224 [Hordeum vulgare]|nr:hypothetical protein ZWY2020_042224 [Hordeum vulgare]